MSSTTVPGLTVLQVRTALALVRSRARDGTLRLTDDLMFGMTVAEFCTSLCLGQNAKRRVKRRRAGR